MQMYIFIECERFGVNAKYKWCVFFVVITLVNCLKTLIKMGCDKRYAMNRTLYFFLGLVDNSWILKELLGTISSVIKIDEMLLIFDSIYWDYGI